MRKLLCKICCYPLVVLLLLSCSYNDVKNKNDNLADQLNSISAIDQKKDEVEKIIIELLDVRASIERFEYDDHCISFQLSDDFALDDSSVNYLSYATKQAYGAELDIHGYAFHRDENQTLAHQSFIHLMDELLKGWTFERKEIISLGGIDFVLIMAFSELKPNQIEYEFSLTNILSDRYVELRFKDTSIGYNYTPEEALDQMRATANKLLRSIKVIEI
ncbi:MAG: hypothetical protein ACI865_002483 [Flavobacteriaceae bacterium]|jgi:hypothetical protein